MRFFACLCIQTISAVLQHELLPYDPVPNAGALVWAGDVLFTISTPNLVRIQKGPLDDRATLAVVHRNLPVPHYSTKAHPFSIETEKIKVSMVGGQISATNLDSGQTWNFNDYPSGNLFGTIRTLDTLGPTNLNCTDFSSNSDDHCEWGLVSRDGWAVLDDTDNLRIDGEDDWHVQAAAPLLDMYLFMHGYEFKQALTDYSLIGGKIPMPHRFMFGVLWTRWYDYDSLDLKALVSGFVGLPLDVLILDMNWHKKPWWGGYTVDERIIPNWDQLIDWMHARGVSIGLNIHDCLLAEPGCPAGTLSSDDTEFWSSYLKHTSIQLATGQQTVRFDLVNKTRALAKEDIVIKSFEGTCDLWWIDWQQGDSPTERNDGGAGNLPGGKANPTIWLNKMRFTNRNRWRKDNQYVKRGSVLSRFGGLGSHRYGIGFSGDVQMLDWENLSYQPFFTATAANVLFSSWSHDVTGPNRDPELFVRWTQWATFSAVLRFHERGMSSGPCAFSSFPLPSKECANVDLWANLPHRFGRAIRQAALLRARLVPYMYTAAMDTFETGVPWIRPLYYEFPRDPEVYNYPSQYMFGDSITVAPIVVQSDVSAPTITRGSIFVPSGTWYSPNDGALIVGPRVVERHWDLSEIPHLMRAGSVIASRYISSDNQHLVGLAKTNFTDLVFFIVPGSLIGSTSVIEDDGETTRYLDHRPRVTFSYIRSAAGVNVTVTRPTNVERWIRIELPNVGKVFSVETDMKTLITYDATNLVALVSVWWPHNMANELFIEILFSSQIDLSGLKGAIAHARFVKAVLDEVVLTPGTHPCWHGMPCGFQKQDDNLITIAAMGEGHFDPQELVKRYRECVNREITVDNILRIDVPWAPTQGGWPEATRLRVNYAVLNINAALDSLCLQGFIMPLVCQQDEDVNSQLKVPDIPNNVAIPEKNAVIIVD